MIASPLNFPAVDSVRDAIQQLFVVGAKKVDVDKGIFLLEKLNHAIGVGEVRRQIEDELPFLFRGSDHIVLGRCAGRMPIQDREADEERER